MQGQVSRGQFLQADYSTMPGRDGIDQGSIQLAPRHDAGVIIINWAFGADSSSHCRRVMSSGTRPAEAAGIAGFPFSTPRPPAEMRGRNESNSRPRPPSYDPGRL